MPNKVIRSCIYMITIGLCIVHLSPVTKAQTDSTPPDTNVVVTPSSPDGNLGWYVSPVRFDLEATDLESGVKELWYRIDSGTWQTLTYENTLNLAPNTSFEISGATSAGVQDWEATLLDPDVTHSQDASEYAPNFSTASARIDTTAGLWHGINHYNTFAVTTPFQNMTASAWLKTANVTGSAYFIVYAIAPDGLGGETIQEVARSSAISGTNGWTRVTLNFTVTLAGANGVYMDVGLEGPGTLWVDAVTLDSAVNTASTTFTVAADSENHRVEFYSVDQVDNIETYTCPSSNCIDFKIDTSPPGNWHGSGATRGFFGPSYHLWVYTNVEDSTSGLSVFTDKFQIHTETDPGYGRHSNILDCGSTWRENDWLFLISPPFSPGANSSFLLAPKTSYCNSDWKICKIARFYAEDLAGNTSMKEFCINGPWIKVRGGAYVRSNSYIDMLSEADGDNTDGLIESVGTTIDFFTSSKDWEITESDEFEHYDYQAFWDSSDTKTEITNGELVSSDGLYYIDGNLTVDADAIPADYDTNTFDQIVFVDGTLQITNNLSLHGTSTALFIVSGDVEIAKTVTNVEVAIMTDGNIFTAYDIEEGDATETLQLNGLYTANQMVFQRTLQGTENNNDPSEDVTFEPKYLIQLKNQFGEFGVSWQRVE